MTADEFVETLQKHAPDVSRMIQLGWDEELAIHVSKRYIVPLRDGPKSEEDFEVLNLLSNYHPEHLEITIISFFDEPEYYVELAEKYIGVGDWYKDYLLLDTETGKILIYDSDYNTFTTCADSSEKLFDALAYIFRTQNWYDRTERSEEEQVKRKEEISRIAGSIDYFEVWGYT